MTKIYVQTNESTGTVLNISTQPSGYIYQEVMLKDSTIDFDKLPGYEVVFTNGEYCLVFNQDKYDAYIAEQKKEEAIKEGDSLMEELTNKSILDNAIDAEAYVMRYKYEEWKPKTKYEVNDRRRYGDNLYKCKQAHTSEEGPDRTPDKLPALWDIVNGDPSKGTKENPILIPEPFSSMVYTYGLYYLENDILYQCERGGVPDPESMYGQEISLTYKPSQLVGHYFKVVESGSTTVDPEPEPEPEEYPEWHAWDGVTLPCPWNKGKKCTHNGKKWVSQVDNNVWEPGGLGVHDTIWKEVVE